MLETQSYSRKQHTRGQDAKTIIKQLSQPKEEKGEKEEIVSRNLKQKRSFQSPHHIALPHLSSPPCPLPPHLSGLEIHLAAYFILHCFHSSSERSGSRISSHPSLNLQGAWRSTPPPRTSHLLPAVPFCTDGRPVCVLSCRGTGS